MSTPPASRRPTVSVVVPTRNRGDLLPRAIASVLRQTFADLELIVVDDASSDHTPEVLARLAAADPRVSAVRSPARRGVSAARNLAVARAVGRYVAFLDDDDEWLPAKLARQVEVLENGDAGLVYCPCLYVGPDGREERMGTEDVSARPAREALFRRNLLSTPAVVVRRDLLCRVGGFDEALPQMEDWDLWLRLAALTPFAYVPEPLVRVHGTPESLSRGGERLLESSRALTAKVQARGDLSRREWADYAYAVGHVLMTGGAPAHGPGMLWRAVRARPWPPQRLLMAMLSLLGRRPYTFVAGAHRRWVDARRAAG